MLPPWREYAASAKAWCTRAKALGHKRVYTNNIGLGTSTRPAGPALHTRARLGDAASAKAWCTRAKALGHQRVYPNNIGLGTSTPPAGQRCILAPGGVRLALWIIHRIE